MSSTTRMLARCAASALGVAGFKRRPRVEQLEKFSYWKSSAVRRSARNARVGVFDFLDLCSNWSRSAVMTASRSESIRSGEQPARSRVSSTLRPGAAGESWRRRTRRPRGA